MGVNTKFTIWHCKFWFYTHPLNGGSSWGGGGVRKNVMKQRKTEEKKRKQRKTVILLTIFVWFVSLYTVINGAVLWSTVKTKAQCHRMQLDLSLFKCRKAEILLPFIGNGDVSIWIIEREVKQLYTINTEYILCMYLFVIYNITYTHAFINHQCLRTPESLRWPIAMSLILSSCVVRRASCVEDYNFHSRTTGPIFTIGGDITL